MFSNEIHFRVVEYHKVNRWELSIMSYKTGVFPQIYYVDRIKYIGILI